MAADGGGGRTPTTVPPPFDPEEFARQSELDLRVAPLGKVDPHATEEVPTAPPLNKRVSLNVPLSDLAWFEISEAAQALAARIDGKKTLMELLELMEGATPPVGLEAVAELQDAGVLRYEA